MFWYKEETPSDRSTVGGSRVDDQLNCFQFTRQRRQQKHHVPPRLPGLCTLSARRGRGHRRPKRGHCTQSSTVVCFRCVAVIRRRLCAIEDNRRTHTTTTNVYSKSVTSVKFIIHKSGRAHCDGREKKRTFDVAVLFPGTWIEHCVYLDKVCSRFLVLSARMHCLCLFCLPNEPIFTAKACPLTDRSGWSNFLDACPQFA